MAKPAPHTRFLTLPRQPTSLQQRGLSQLHLALEVIEP